MIHLEIAEHLESKLKKDNGNHEIRAELCEQLEKALHKKSVPKYLIPRVEESLKHHMKILEHDQVLEG